MQKNEEDRYTTGRYTGMAVVVAIRGIGVMEG